MIKEDLTRILMWALCIFMIKLVTIKMVNGGRIMRGIGGWVGETRIRK